MKQLIFPEVHQSHDYDCGVHALLAVLIYYGIQAYAGEITRELRRMRNGIEKHGAKTEFLRLIAEERGLDAEILYDIGTKDIRRLIDQGTPSIILLQAWRSPRAKKPWREENRHGHYAVAVGYTRKSIIFEDPSAFTRVRLSNLELEDRWHGPGDHGGTVRLALVVYGKPKYRLEINHMD